MNGEPVRSALRGGGPDEGIANPGSNRDGRQNQMSKRHKGCKELVATLDPDSPHPNQTVQPKDGEKLIRLDQVKDEIIQWLFPNLIPLGSVTILDGSKAEGKSTLTYDLVARLTAGIPMPFCDGHTITGGAILLQAEDDLGATVKRSILTAGGNLDKIRVFSKLEALHLDDAGDLELIQRTAKEINARLMVADPCTEFFSKSLKDERTIRKSLRFFRALAASLNMAIILVRHFTKSGSNTLHRGLGGVAVINAARAGWWSAMIPRPTTPISTFSLSMRAISHGHAMYPWSTVR